MLDYQITGCRHIPGETPPEPPRLDYDLLIRGEMPDGLREMELDGVEEKLGEMLEAKGYPVPGPLLDFRVNIEALSPVFEIPSTDTVDAGGMQQYEVQATFKDEEKDLGVSEPIQAQAAGSVDSTDNLPLGSCPNCGSKVREKDDDRIVGRDEVYCDIVCYNEAVVG